MSFKDLFVTTDPSSEKAKPAKPAPSPPNVVPAPYNLGSATSPAMVMAPASTASEVTGDVDRFYASLFGATDPEKTAVFQAIDVLMVPLESFIPDKNARFAAAFKQAVAMNKIQASDIVSAIQGLTNALELEQTKFQAAIAAKQKTGVDDKQARLEQIKSRLDQLEQEKQALQTEGANASQAIAEATTKIRSSTAAFQQACARRKQEIEQLNSTYTALATR
jgi:hypothetical protein